MIIWKDIPGWKGIYQSSRCGKIRSKERTVKVFWQGKWRIKTYKSKILSVTACLKYPHVTLVRGKKRRVAYVHDLILLTFKGKKPKGLEVLHNNGNHKDSRLSNLRYGTRSENHLEKFKHGYVQWNKGFKNDE